MTFSRLACFFLVFAFLGNAFPGYFSLRADLNLGASRAETSKEFAVDTLERFGKNWRSLQIPLETGRVYEETILPFFALTFSAGYKDFFLLIEAPLRKDLEAWYDSDYGETWTFHPSELDINVPTKAYARWSNPVGFVQLGRFKPDLGPSENTLTLSGAPYIDAIWWKFTPSIFRYDFVLASLSAWLHGDTRESSGCPPEKTEAFAQKCPSASKLYENNQRGRIYDENQKNLVYHRLGIDLDYLFASFTEMSMIGGKSLEFRSMNPFMFLHDNYSSGYTKASATFELGARPARGSTFYGQINMEDLNSPVGETGGGTTRSVLSYLVGYSQKIQTNRFGLFQFKLDIVRTDPAYNQGHLPLLAYTNRKMYRSNYRDQSDKDFADMFYVDYPIGYRRGSDALDIWLLLGWEYGRHIVSASFALLRQGDKELYGSYDEAISASGILTGVCETQYIVDFLYKNQLRDFFEFYLGSGFRIYENLDHIRNEDGADFRFRAGVSLSIELLIGNRPQKNSSEKN